MDADEEQTAITASLELCAERSEDLVPPVFERFFAQDAAAHELMKHSDQPMQGRMFEGVLDLLLTDEHLVPGGYLDWELDNHLDAYAATPAMYRSFLDAIVDVVRETVGAEWSDTFAAAWDARIDRIMARVDAHTSAH